MELIEINTDFQINVGAPEPIILSNDTSIIINFYAEITGDVSESEEQIITLKFIHYSKFTFGMPGNETIHGHPYSKLGMESFSFYELKDSDLIRDLKNISKIHPYFKSESWMDAKHYIITFHDNMFECIAQNFEIQYGCESIYHKANTLINELITI